MSGKRSVLILLAVLALLAAASCGKGGAPDANEEGLAAETADASAAGAAPAVEPFISETQLPPGPALTLEGHEGGVSALAFTPDGVTLISASYADQTIRTWDPAAGVETSSVRTARRVRSIALSAGRDKLLAADARGAVASYAFEGGTIGAVVATLENAGDSIAISPDSRFLAVTAFRKPVDVWQFDSGSILRTLTAPFDVRLLVFDPTGKRLAGAGDGNAVAVWDVGRWKPRIAPVARAAAESSAAALDFSPDGRFLAAGFSDGSVAILDLKQGRELRDCSVPDAPAFAVRFSPDGMFLATAHEDKAVYVWDRDTGRLLAKLEGRDKPVTSLAFSPDGRVLAAGGEDRRIVLWKAGAGAAPDVETVPEDEAVSEAEPAAASKAEKPAAETPGGAGPEFLKLEKRPNLVRNPSANRQAREWQADGEAGVDLTEDGDPYFAVRNGGSFRQVVDIAGSAGRTVLVVALAACERIDTGGDPTGLPLLSGAMTGAEDARDVTARLAARTMRLAAKTPGQWGVVWGAFRIPPGTGSLRLVLGQAEGAAPHDGSAAWFDDVGVFLFDSDEEARAAVPVFEKRYPPAP